ncbi:MAG TPA: hypothetical protein VLT91_03540 [Rhizomicrobium sp.]|nr:hypothetical protein [Rhizomicrobium sp.]
MRRFGIHLALILAAMCAAAAQAAPASIQLGSAVVPLNAPWKFHTGDDARWASVDFDDAQWETYDLTPKAGAHDGDVGLKGYVAGWNARGHRNYSGYAWYRMAVRVRGANSSTLWIDGPAAVDSAYQLYFNGRLIGSDGDFSRDPPSIVSIQPRLFALPRGLWHADGDALSGVVAIRVYTVKAGAVPPDYGGIHIAPLLGNEKGASDHYRGQWLQTFEGYVVDASEGLIFLMLAVMALSILPFDRGNSFYVWSAVALCLAGFARGNQAIYFWGQTETYIEIVLLRIVLADGLVFGAFAMAWRAAFGLRQERWSAIAAAALTAGYIVTRFCGLYMVSSHLWAGAGALFADLHQIVRFGLLALFIYLAIRGAMRRETGAWIGVAALIFLGIGLFAQEVGMLGVQGIWFPFGVGVSRTEYAHAVFDVLMFAYLLARLWHFAPQGRVVNKAS